MPSGLGAFRSYLCVGIFSATIKPKNSVEIFIVPMNPGAGSSQNVHGSFGKTHELRMHRLEFRDCCVVLSMFSLCNNM